jgi:predicted XRE-type DNA-binding protein
MTQKEAAKLFSVTQPRVSDVVRGKIELFTVDALVKMLSAAGVKVGVVVNDQSSRLPSI